MSSFLEEFDSACTRFEQFGAVLDLTSRKYFVAYLKQKVNHFYVPPANIKPGYLQYFTKHLDALFNEELLKEVFEINENLSAQVAMDILYWFRKVAAKINQKHPYEDEVMSIENWGIRPLSKLAETWPFMLRNAATYYPESTLSTAFYKKEFELHFQNFEEKSKQIKERLELLVNDFLGSWDALLQSKILDFQLRNFEEEMQTFSELLLKKLNEVKRLNQIIKPFESNMGSHWDMSRSLWNETSFQVIQHYNEILRNEKYLQELADMLGKLREAEIETEQEELEKVLVRKAWYKDPMQRGEINGVRMGNELNAVISSEFGLWAETYTQDAFLQKFAERNLLQQAYHDEILMHHPFQYFETESKIKLKEKGPFIICVDTSGSMEGEAERIAKVLAFAVTKMAAKENRKAFLISFSSGVKTLNLLRLADSLDSLAKFLSYSFHGGTDISLALHEAMKQLEEQQYKDADVLVISDFIMYKIDEDILEKMAFQQQQKGTQFHSLIISDEANTRIIEQFDHVWQYNPAEKGIVKQLYLHMKEVMQRKL
jgi:uncharacterized protein with von Willebrand factor type A (vWA) domain